MRQITVKRTLAAAAITLAAASGAGTAAVMTAAPASADVLVNDDAGIITLGQPLDVGVWYQSFSGGPRGYWEGVWSVPQHKWIFTHSGQASPAGPMKIWPIRPREPGKYDTVYLTSNNARTYRTVFATTVKPVAALAAETTAYVHQAPPAMVSSYSCVRSIIGWPASGHPIYAEVCTVNVAFTGPSGRWTLYIQAPRPEMLTNFAWQVNDSSEMGSTAGQTKAAPLTVGGYPDDYADGILPAGQTSTGWFTFDTPMNEPIPRVSIQATR